MAKRSSTLRRSKVINRALVFNIGYVALVFSALSLFFLDTSGVQFMQRFRSSADDFVAPIVKLINSPVVFTRTIVEGVADLAYLREENELLRQENDQLKTWRDLAMKLQVENKTLQELSNFIVNAEEKFVTAQVINQAGGPFIRTALVDAGRSSGVVPQSAAVTEDGLAGRVTHVGEKTSRLLLVTDMNSRIPVYVGGRYLTAVMAGDNSETPRLIYLEDSESLRVGDRIVTSGHGGVLSPYVPIGYISSIKGSNVRVQLNVDFSHLQLVKLVLREPENIDQDSSSNQLVK